MRITTTTQMPTINKYEFGAEDEHAGVLEADWEDRMNAIGPELSVNIETVRQIRNQANVYL